MSRKKPQKKLFFSKTLEFLESYLPQQALKSRNTVETYRDALTVFRRYVTDTLHLSIRSFGFEDCTHDFLLSYMEFLNKKGNAETTCNNRLAAIRAYLWYVADGDISLQSVALTASHVPFLKVPKLTREMIAEEDLKALLSAPPDTKIGRRDQMILILLYDSAVRVFGDAISEARITIVTHGRIAATALEAAEALRAEGIATRVLLCEYLAPYGDLSKEILPLLGGAVLFLEEEILSGGFGMNLASALQAQEAFAERKYEILATVDGFLTPCAGQTPLQAAGLDAQTIIQKAKRLADQ